MTNHGAPVGIHRNTYTSVGGTTEMIAAYRCDHCLRLTIAYAVTGGLVATAGELARRLDILSDDQSDSIRWFPRYRKKPAFEDVPEQIASAANEAYECLSINANRGAIALARAVVEAVSKNKGVTSGTLFQKIDKLHELGFVRPHIRDGLHEVRHLGNEMAHGDFAEAVSSGEAALALTLMAELLTEVYESPARVI